jgi:hypothetical protein
VAKAGKFWNSPEFLQDGGSVVLDMLYEMPFDPKAQMISVMEQWIKKNTYRTDILRGEYSAKSFSVRCSGQRFIFFTGRFELDAGDCCISSIDHYFQSSQMWDPEWLDTDECNLRMPGESFPLPEQCELEPDTWWCYRTRPDSSRDPEWFIFSYKEGKLFSRHFRRVFGPGSVDDEQFRNAGRDQFHILQAITY